MLNQRRALDLRIVVVAFAEPDALRRYQQGLGLQETVVLGDPGRLTYRAFGFTRGSIARVWLDPRVWWRCANLLARGRRLGRAEQDTLQLGGNALVAADGRIAWVYRSSGPEDRPTLAVLNAALAAMRAAPRGARGSS